MALELLSHHSKGIVFVLSAPAGTGKTTLVRMLTEEFSQVEESVSFTTRAPRSGEVDGKDYYFITKEEFAKKIQAGDFLEYAEVFGHYYGTGKQQVERRIGLGKHVILVIDTQGALKLQEMQFSAVYIFLSPPSMQELRDRLSKRKTEGEAELNYRLSWAEKEIQQSSHYDYQIVNENLHTAYQILRSILIAEDHKIR